MSRYIALGLGYEEKERSGSGISATYSFRPPFPQQKKESLIWERKETKIENVKREY